MNDDLAGVKPRVNVARPPARPLEAMRRLALAVVMSVGSVACGGASLAPSNGSASKPGSIVASPPASASSATAHPSTSPTPAALASPISSPISLPVRGRILFVIERDSGNRLIKIDPTELHEIPMSVTSDTSFGHPVWASADAILFDSDRGVGPRHIFRMSVDGGEVRQVTPTESAQDNVAVSADGSMIAYSQSIEPTNSTFGQDLGLQIANADGTEVRALTKPGEPGARGGDHGPAFSPDGTRVVFERTVDPEAGTAGLFVIGTNGSDQRRLTQDATGAGNPRWSPDGKTILFTGRNSATTFAPNPLWVIDIAGGAPRPLTDPEDPGVSFAGDWSPDGQQIVYIYFRPGWDHNELRLVNADGTNQTTLWAPGPTDGGGADGLDWG